MNTAVTDLLPAQSLIHDSPYKDLINNTIGYFLELIEEQVQMMNDGCFLETAEAEYLDLWGKDYSIRRKNDETDEEYRKRLSLLPLGQFNIQTLYDVYDLQLLTRDNDTFNDMKLYSDNHYLGKKYWVNVSDDEWSEISEKFVVDDVLRRVVL